jgi:hypothetical protein
MNDGVVVKTAIEGEILKRMMEQEGSGDLSAL